MTDWDIVVREMVRHQAVCQQGFGLNVDQHEEPLVDGQRRCPWVGPVRDTEEQATRDAQAHAADHQAGWDRYQQRVERAAATDARLAGHLATGECRSCHLPVLRQADKKWEHDDGDSPCPNLRPVVTCCLDHSIEQMTIENLAGW